MALPRLSDTALQFPIGEQEFTPLVADTLGDHATERDGFDALLLDAAAPLEGDIAALVDLDQFAADADFAPGDFKAQTLGPVAADWQGFLSDGQKVYDDTVGAFVGDAFQNPEKPPDAPPPNPAPPDLPPEPGGGGGGGGGEAGGGEAGGGAAAIECQLHPERPECQGERGGL